MQTPLRTSANFARRRPTTGIVCMIHLIGAARLPCWDSGMERCVNRCTRRLSFRGGAVAVRNGLHIIEPNSRLSDDLNA